MYIKRCVTISVIALVAITLTSCQFAVDKQDSNLNKKDLLAQFTNAYPDEVDANDQTVEVDIVARETEYQGIDGRTLKGFAYNGQVPGPQIEAVLGDTIRINFTNQLPQPTTIHFHGIRVPNNMDGVPALTQEPIQPGESFIYEFTPKDAGTFWYHPHVRGSEQLEKGLYGTIIVHEKENIGFSQDIVWVIDDWRLNNYGQINNQFNSMHDLMHDGRWGNTITVNGSTQENLKLNPGEIVRARIINASNARVYQLYFGQLTAQLFSVDGISLNSFVDANGFDLSPGNHIDVMLKAPEELSGRTATIQDKFTRLNNQLVSVEIGTSFAKTSLNLPTARTIPDWSSASGLTPDYSYSLNATRTGMMQLEWQINGETYPQITKTTLNSGEFYVLEMVNQTTRLHPMHIHGQFFQLISRNGKPVDEPYFRDTVLVGPRDTIKIGIVPIDEGSWAYHCHAQEHAEAGMMSVIEVI